MTSANPTADCLFEIGTEELPANQLTNLRDSFTNNLKKQLETHGLTFEKIQSFVTPRRLAVLISNLSTLQPPQTILRKGPSKNVALDEKGNPTQAVLKFAESCGVPFEALTLQETKQGAWYILEQTKIGQKTEQLLPSIIKEAFKDLPLGRQMRWGSFDFNFLRPVHWVVLLLGNKVIPCELFGLKSSNITYGHRFLAPNPIVVATPSDYEGLLEKNYVVPDFDKRKQKIDDELRKAAPNNTYVNAKLLDEVSGIVEWPVVLTGNFDPEFLKIPQEVLITSMQNHQKCFPVGDKNQQLFPQFLIVSNIESKDPKQVIAGNESVIHARLSDAAFYYEVDRKTTLEQFREGLKNVRFQQGLGTLWDKSERMAQLAEFIATKLQNNKVDINPALAKKAAELCKADLLTQMVGEFPELQGIMGYEYYKDTDPEVTKAIKEHYWPRVYTVTLRDDDKPKEVVLGAPLGGSSVLSPLGKVIALTDRIDNLVGLFGIGKQPTGDKDPFSLRRQGLEVMQLLIGQKLDLDLKELLSESLKVYSQQVKIADKTQEILDFCFERERGRSSDDIKPLFDAVLSLKPTNPWDFKKRLNAVNNFKNTNQSSGNFQSLVSANKRVKNILEKSGKSIVTNTPINHYLLKEEAEIVLEKEITEVSHEIISSLEKRDYKEVLIQLSKLRDPIDQFFEKVMVMVDDEAIKNNRLSLLWHLRTLFLKIADISLL